jgi:hypothetical protein
MSAVETVTSFISTILWKLLHHAIGMKDWVIDYEYAIDVQCIDVYYGLYALKELSILFG